MPDFGDRLSSREGSPFSRTSQEFVSPSSQPKHRTSKTFDLQSISSLSADEADFAMSTRPNIDDDSGLPQMRPTARKRAMFNPPQPRQHIPSSIGRDSFKDFDHNDALQSDESVEIGRGLPRGSKGTPSKLKQSHFATDVILDIAPSSPAEYKTTPLNRAKQNRKALGAERGDLRRNAQLRKALVNPAISTQNTHTDNSFALPDMTGLSNLIDTHEEPKAAGRGRARLTEGTRRVSIPVDQFRPVESVPMSEENKWQIYSLQLLEEKLDKLEQENKQLISQCHAYQARVEDLEEELNVQNTIRQTDSAFGSDDGHRSTKNDQIKLQVENARLHATVRRLTRQVEEFQSQAEHSQTLTQRARLERNSAMSDTNKVESQTVKFKSENSKLKKENRQLRQRVSELEAMNEELQAQLDNTQDRHDDATENWTQQERNLTQRLNEDETGIFAENQTLHQELVELRTKYDHDVERLRGEAENRRAAARAAQAEHAKLQVENQQLKSQLQATKEKQNREQAKPQTRGNLRPEVQERVNDDLRHENNELKAELTVLKANLRSTGTNTASRSRSRHTIQNKVDLPIRPSRRAQSPSEASQDEDVESPPESTTDLSHVFGHKNASGKVASTAASRKKPISQLPADTYISVMSPEDIINIRKTIEEEYASRKARIASAEQNTSRSRKSSLKNTSRPATLTAGLVDDTTSGSQHSRRLDARDNAVEAQQETQNSRRSSLVSRRRTPAPAGHEGGMTSALILPDFTIHNTGTRPTLSTTARTVISGLAPHSPGQCTVCHRIVSAQNPSAAPASPKISIPDLVSSKQVEIDATVRPSEPPLKALSRVIRQLADEIVHLKLDLHNVERRLAAHDPSRSKRDRDNLHEMIELLNKNIAIKCDQMYSLHDVLEGHKPEIEDAKEAKEVNDELDQDVTEDVREILEELKAGRRVTIQSPPASLGKNLRATVEEDDTNDLPWDGFTETGSLASKRR